MRTAGVRIGAADDAYRRSEGREVETGEGRRRSRKLTGPHWRTHVTRTISSVCISLHFIVSPATRPLHTSVLPSSCHCTHQSQRHAPGARTYTHTPLQSGPLASTDPMGNCCSQEKSSESYQRHEDSSSAAQDAAPATWSSPFAAPKLQQVPLSSRDKQQREKTW